MFLIAMLIMYVIANIRYWRYARHYEPSFRLLTPRMAMSSWYLITYHSSNAVKVKRKIIGIVAAVLLVAIATDLLVLSILV